MGSRRAEGQVVASPGTQTPATARTSRATTPAMRSSFSGSTRTPATARSSMSGKAKATHNSHTPGTLGTANSATFDRDKLDNLEKQLDGAGPKYAIERGHAIVPAKLEELDDRGRVQELKELEDRAFFRCATLVSVDLPACCKTLGTSAFSGCTALTHITLPDHLQGIGVAAFHNCSALRTITWPHDLKKIGRNAFRRCTALRKIELPEGIVEIEASTFQDCTALETVELPSSLETVRDGAFAGCTALTTVNLSGGIKTLGNKVFEGCTHLTNSAAKLPQRLQHFGDSVYGGCPEITALRLPSGLEMHNIRLLRPVHLPQSTDDLAKLKSQAKSQRSRGKTGKTVAEKAREEASKREGERAARRKSVEAGEAVTDPQLDFRIPPGWKAIKLAPRPATPFAEMRQSLKQLGREHLTSITWVPRRVRD